MKDSQLEGAPILLKTLCTIGAHVFVWASVENTKALFKSMPYDVNLRCSCGAYTWGQWQVQANE